MLSFANLENDSDEDKGPVIKDRDSVEFLLKKDNSVQKIENQAELNLRSSADMTSRQ